MSPLVIFFLSPYIAASFLLRGFISLAFSFSCIQACLSLFLVTVSKVPGSIDTTETPGFQRKCFACRITVRLLHWSLHTRKSCSKRHTSRRCPRLQRSLEICPFGTLEMITSLLVQTTFFVLINFFDHDEKGCEPPRQSCEDITKRSAYLGGRILMKK
mgnify:CR=1 FL=1